MNTVQGYQAGGDTRKPFILLYDDGPFEVEPGEIFQFSIYFQIPSQFYLYDENLTVELTESSNIKLLKMTKSEPTIKYDEIFKKDLAIHYNEVKVDLDFKVSDTFPGKEEIISGIIKYQGCSYGETSLCYPMMKDPLKISFQAKKKDLSPAQTDQNLNLDSSLSLIDRLKAFIEKPDFNQILKEGFFFALLIAFIGGVLTDFTPCVLPMIPITLAVIGVRKNQSVLKNFLASVILVLGMSVMYAVLGLLAASFGQSLGFLFQSPYFLILIVLILGLFSLSLLGLFEIQLPVGVQTKLASISASGYRGVFFVGLTLGLLAAPCVGPIVGPLLVFVAKSQDLLLGLSLLLAYAVGMGVIFLVLGTFQSIIQIKIKTGGFSVWLKRCLGLLMLVVTLFYGKIVYSQFFPDSHDTIHSNQKVWINNLEEGLEKSKREGKPVVIDFFASWCLPCVELDHQVWEKSEMMSYLNQDWVAIKIDCTQDTAECSEAVEAYDVIGWPTVIFLDSDRKEVQDQRIEGKIISLEEMMDVMREIEAL